MAANNEIGVLQPLEQLGAVCRRHGITLHSDGAQAFGTLPLTPDALGVDLLSLSAHKLYGPKGIGALVLREGIAIEPLQWGGGQEAGLRAGTLPTALIVGFATAARLTLQEQDQRNSRLQHLRDQLWDGNAKGETVKAVEVRTENTTYLVKISSKLEQTMEDYLDDEDSFDDNDDFDVNLPDDNKD